MIHKKILFSLIIFLFSLNSFGQDKNLMHLDISSHSWRQVVVDREKGRYLGHPTTVLLEDGTTIIAVYPMGHGGGQIIMKKSTNGGRMWGKHLPVPENWSTSKEVPTIFRTIDSAGVRRLILFSGLYPARLAYSENDGHTWTPLEPVGEWGGIVVMASVVKLKDNRYLAMFHDDGRFLLKDGKISNWMTIYKTFSGDGGLKWSHPEAVFRADTIALCEPGVIRSPDGRQLAALLRENSRRRNSFIMFSDDEGKTWTSPRELPLPLTGDRHTGKYASDGRFLISFRDMARNSPTHGDWIAWIGTYDDLLKGRDGQYRVRLMDNKVSADCAYPGVEILNDGTFVLTTYGHWITDEEPYIVSVHLRLEELDDLAKLR